VDRFKEAFVVFYFGDTSHRRGTSFLIESMPEVVECIPEAQLVIVGRNTRADPELQAQAAESSVSAHIHLEGFRPLAELGSYLSVASIGVSPLVRNRHHDTTYANKLFQYMYGGVPLLVSDCPSQANLVERTGTGLVHRAMDTADFVGRVRELHSKKESRHAMGDKGRELSHTEFVWTNCMADYVTRVGPTAAEPISPNSVDKAPKS
jgi:glycosyltransferase involved in cell wall biosynthesis